MYKNRRFQTLSELKAHRKETHTTGIKVTGKITLQPSSDTKKNATKKGNHIRKKTVFP
jgi:hypothetical protein